MSKPEIDPHSHRVGSSGIGAAYLKAFLQAG